MTAAAAATEHPHKPLDMRVPTAEELVDIEKEIQRLISRKQQVDQRLVELEGRIYDAETRYFRDTAQFGSILTGLHGYLGVAAGAAASSAAVATPSSLRRSSNKVVRDADRVFSATSSTSKRAVSLFHRKSSAAAADVEAASSEEDLAPSPAQTPSRQRSRSSGSRKRAHDPSWTNPRKRSR